MPDQKIIAVIGATGAQGGGLVRAILDDPDKTFAVRAITRNASSDRARELEAAGAEVVEADMNDADSLRAAFDGAYGAYCVTAFWEHFSAETEKEHAGNLAQAAADASLQHVIWSTLEDTRKWVHLDDDRMPTIKDSYKVPHYDAKGEADQYFVDAGVPTTFLLTSFYWDNLIHFGSGPKRDAEGRLAFTLPMGDAKLSSIATTDIGKAALGIFKRGDEYIGKRVGIAGGHLSGREIAEALSKALGEDVYHNDVPADVYRSLGFPGADDLGNMFQFKADFNEYYVGVRSIEETRTLNPELQSFSEWLAENASRIPTD